MGDGIVRLSAESIVVAFSCAGTAESGIMLPMKYWEIIADKLSAAGWASDYCRAVTRNAWRWTVDAHRRDGRWYIVESDEPLAAFLELESILLR